MLATGQRGRGDASLSAWKSDERKSLLTNQKHSDDDDRRGNVTYYKGTF